MIYSSYTKFCVKLSYIFLDMPVRNIINFSALFGFSAEGCKNWGLGSRQKTSWFSVIPVFHTLFRLKYRLHTYYIHSALLMSSPTKSEHGAQSGRDCSVSIQLTHWTRELTKRRGNTWPESLPCIGLFYLTQNSTLQPSCPGGVDLVRWKVRWNNNLQTRSRLSLQNSLRPVLFT